MAMSKDKFAYLFHDLLNQTHSLNLFLEQKISQQMPLTLEEMELMKQEIEVLEHIIFKQQNSMLQEPLAFSDFYCWLERLLKTYLAEWNIHLQQEGNFSTLFFADFISLHRIFTNLIKNIAASGGSNLTIHLKLQPQRVVINLQNDFIESSAEIHHGQGVGQLAISSLVEELGGKYFFHNQSNLWHTILELPFVEDIDLAA